MDLKLVADLTKQLSELGYPDSSRTAKEIEKYLYNNKEISATQILERLRDNEPWEYIRGYAEFYGRKFNVTPAVLIPRIETETLIDLALETLKQDSYTNIIDVGTGSGAIAITLTLESGRNIIASDISEKALKVCEKNIKQYELEDQISVNNTDLIDSIQFAERTLIVANLPYIPTSEYEQLDPSVRDWEPQIALESGQTGTDHYGRLLMQLKAKEILEQTTLLLEITESNIPSLKELATQHNLQIKIIEDAFKRPRFAKLNQ